MAINASIKVYPGAEITARDFAILVDSLSPESDGRIIGCSVSGSGTSVTVTSGWCLLHGRLVRVNGSGTGLTVSKPGSGTRTRYVVLGIDLVTGDVSLAAMSSIPEDTENFNTASGSSIMAYLNLATLTIGPNGITKVVKTPIMRQHDNLIYRKVVSKKELHGNKDTGYDIVLMRNNYLVTCNFKYIGIIPSKKVNKAMSLGTIIPEGYRPDDSFEKGIRIPYMQVSSHNVNGGRGQWIIESNGKVTGESNFEGYIERFGTATWITSDDFPGKVYEDLDDT